MRDIDVVVARARQLGERLLEPSRQLLAPFEVSFLRLALEALHHLRGRARAHVGVDQRLLEALPGLIVERARESRPQLARKRLTALREIRAKASEEPLALGLGLGPWLGPRAVSSLEHLLPGLGHGGRL